VDGNKIVAINKHCGALTIFIDGIDEYFNKHVEDLPASPSVTGELSPNVWYFAQLGLVEVAYQLRRINHHLKVFAAVRKEAYARLPEDAHRPRARREARSSSGPRISIGRH
jgi:hypothetical protein